MTLRLFALLAFLTSAESAEAQTFEIQGQEGTECAAFAFDKNIIATAAHCTLGGDRFRIMGLEIEGEGRVMIRGPIDGIWLTENEKTAVDVALLATDLKLPRAPRQGARNARIGEILEIHPPGGGYSRCKVLEAYGNAYDLACRINSGWSGSPIYTTNSFGPRMLIGMVSGRVDPFDAEIAVMVHVRAFSKLLNSAHFR